MRISNDTLISTPVDLSTDWTSQPIWLGHIYFYSIQLVFDGAPAGVFRLQCCNDKENDASNPTNLQNWTLYSGSSQVVEEAGNHTWSVSDAGYRWVRVQWVAAAGTGNLTSAIFNAKGV